MDEDAFVDDILNSKKDPGTRIETKSYKESLEVMNDVDMVPVDVNKEEEELVEEKLERIRREKGKGIKETRTSPHPTLIRSPMIHTEDALLSTNKEKLQELTVHDFVPSSSTPTLLKPRIESTLREVLPLMVNKEVNNIAKTTVPVYVAQGLLLEKQKTQDDVANQIAYFIQMERENLWAEAISKVNDAIVNHIPSQVDSLLGD
ncbi:hypothetical protein Tco_0536644 [Tanacetum coccineum]